MRHSRALLIALTFAMLSFTAPPASAAGVESAQRPWLDSSLSPDRRADLLLRAMTRSEKLSLVFGYFGTVMPSAHYTRPPQARPGSAGYVPGITRLGLPPQWLTDAGLGVATQRASLYAVREATALPSGLATAATWNAALAQRSGAMIGAEARAYGFNVLLGPGLDLVREVRGGRSFEYAGEDPLLAGEIAAAEIRGIQSQHVIAVAKHYALNDQETGRTVLSADISAAAARESDLLAFELAVEQGQPGAVMCAYNRVNGVHACESEWLLEGVLKGDWGFRGYVMSDWGAVHSTVPSALAGLDQESGYVFDSRPYFGAALREAVAAGQVPAARLDDMARRILRSMFAVGVVDHPVENPSATIDFAADLRVAEADEDQGIVLLKNGGGVLPLPRTMSELLVIGGHADRGVLSGGGSSTVSPVGANAVPGLATPGWQGPEIYLPSAPLGAIMGQAPQVNIRYLNGDDIAAAARAAARASRVIVFATQWAAEGLDVPLLLDGDQDKLIAAVAAANPHTVVVLETNGPVAMPWLDKAAAVLEAWYPGSGGGPAITKVLFGDIDPSGRLPVTFPASPSQLPHPQLPGLGMPDGKPFNVAYAAGAEVGYKWFQQRDQTPLFPFGYGLTYTHFRYSGLRTQVAGGQLTVSLTVTNAGDRGGAAVPEVYVGPVSGGWEAPRRLAGWSRVMLRPGGSATLSIPIDPRLLALFDEAHHRWQRPAGMYHVWVGESAASYALASAVRLPAWSHPARWLPASSAAR
ncbi:MAG TPA: glycoside hydrolase family 3 C-terminal domain-containing protein [Steroidobacteraceae bacterium]|nr:glycoside hydrolase family 3 C-terminal domain-containing protein [Steroidobacteraceae bacterium]